MRKALLLLPLLSLTAKGVAHAETATTEPSSAEPETLAPVAPPVEAHEVRQDALIQVAGDPLAKQNLWKAVDTGDVAMLDAAIQGGANVLETRDGGKTPLMVAARAGEVDIVTHLLSAGAEVDTADEAGYTALGHAVEGRSQDCVQLLLDAQATPNVMNAKGETPLYRLCADFRYLHRASLNVGQLKSEPVRRARLLSLIGTLLDKGADPNLFAGATCSPLTMAARFGEKPVVDMLLRSGADASGRNQAAIDADRAAAAGIKEVSENTNDSDDAESTHWNTPLQAVLNGGQRAQVERLFISDGGTISPSERDALRQHAEETDLAIVNRLLEAGAKPEKGIDRFALLDAAAGSSVGSSRAELVKRLAAKGALVQTDDMARRIALEKNSVPSRQGEIRLVRAVTGPKADMPGAAKPKPRIVDGVTVPITLKVSAMDCLAAPRKVPSSPLFASRPQLSETQPVEADTDSTRTARFVITGVHVTSPAFVPRDPVAAPAGERPVYSRTAIFAKLAPQPEVTKAPQVFKVPDADKAFDAFYGVPQGLTPLMQAARSGDVETVKFLLDQGANPNEADARGKTALMHLCGTGRMRWVRELPAQRAEALVQLDNDDPRAASRVVSYAEKNQWREWAEDGDLEIARVLIKAGAKVNTRDLEGRTPLMYAARRSSPEVVRELLRHGADANAQDKGGKTALMQVIGGGRYAAAPSWISPLLRDEAEVATTRAQRDASFASSVWAQEKREQYELHRDLITQEAERDDSIVLCELRRAGTDLNLRDARGKTAMEMAIAAGQQHAIRWLMGEVY